jgi:four helix bundle protein
MPQPKDILQRTFDFGMRVIKVVRSLPTDVAGRELGRQLFRAGLSVGANVEEAQASHSRAEFARRMNIARSEARECLFWLRAASESGMLGKQRLSLLIREANELVSILTAIVKRTRKAGE